MNGERSKSTLIYIIIFAFTLGVLVFSGYLGFRYFADSVVGNFTAFSLLLVAVVAGIAVFFSPCSFPFIPAYLGKYYTLKEKTGKVNPMVLGLFAALGLLTFNILLGLAIALIGEGFGRSLSISGKDPRSLVRLLRGFVGFFLVLTGFSHTTGRGLNLHSLQAKAPSIGSENPFLGVYSYGFLYTLIGIGCGGPILAGLSVFAFTTGGFSSALLVFIVYSLAMAFLMISISILASLSKKALIDRLTVNTGNIKKVSGIIIMFVGLFLIGSSIFLKSFTTFLFP
jgi:cytochrome c-type biogenesis protein